MWAGISVGAGQESGGEERKGSSLRASHKNMCACSHKIKMRAVHNKNKEALVCRWCFVDSVHYVHSVPSVPLCVLRGK